MPSEAAKPAARLIAVVLDPGSIGRTRPEIEHERDVAIFDLIEANTFALEGGPSGPYRLQIGIVEERLVLDVRDEVAVQLASFQLSLGAFRRLIKDYFLICDSYHEAIRTAPPSRIEAIDMGRRGLHDEGSGLLLDRLKGKVALDFETARRLFTLICALHWKG
jgi:uncharacterized protein (UPF0262 family)